MTFGEAAQSRRSPGGGCVTAARAPLLELRRPAVSLAALAAALGPTLVAAQTPSTVEPGVIEKEFAKPAALLSVGAAPPALNTAQEAPPGADKLRFSLDRLEFGAATVFSPQELASFGEGYVGREISVVDLYAIAAAITRAYSDRGYALSIAFVPEQKIDDGVARIEIVEGFVSEVEIAGDPGRARDFLEKHGRKLMRERPLRAKTLERYLLLANDIPGLHVRAVFDKAPSVNGGVKLVLNAEPWRFDIAGGINNRGSRALGRFRGVLSLAENGNLTGRERVAVDYVQTFQARELSYVQARADYRLNAEGTNLGLAGTFTSSHPGTALLSTLDFNSDGWTVEASVTHPVIRSRDLNLRLNASFDVKELKSAFGALAASDDSIRAFRAGATLDLADATGARTQVLATLSKGVGLFDATRDGDPNKSRADGSGVFFSAYGQASRTQPLLGTLEAYVAGGAQIASRPLLASEECGYGGGSFGRAFDNYEIAGENCVFGLAELRYTRAIGSGKTRAQPFVYYDAGSVWQIGALLPGEPRRETGQSVGGGVRFFIGDHLYADVEYSKPLTRDVALEGDDDGRVFFTIWAAR